MYIKLNFTNTVAWKDVFNMVRIILSNNITSANDLKNNSDFSNNSIIDANTNGYYDVSNSEIVRTDSPGVGYGAATGTYGVYWTYNWAGSTNPAVYTTYTSGPEIVIQRTVSTYVPSGNSDTNGKYYIRLRYDGSNFTLGTYKSAAGMGSGAQVSGNGSTSPTLSTGEDRIIGYGMTGVTSFFMYMTPYSILVGGRGPIGTNSVTQGWLMTANRTVSSVSIAASTTQTLAGISRYIPDGSLISFSTTAGGINSSLYYYFRNIGVNTWSFATDLYSLHTGSYVSVSAGSTQDIKVYSYLPHNINANNPSAAHFGPAFVSEFTPYDATAICSNNYLPVIYSGGYTNHFIYNSGVITVAPKSWYGISAQDFLFADPYHVRESYKLLSIQIPTPTLTNSWTVNTSAPVYIGTDLRTIERAPLGDSNTGTAVTDRSLSAVLLDQPGYKFPDASGNPSFGLFPLTWSNSSYNSAGGKLSPALAGFMLFNGDYSPDDYFTYSGTTYALWPMADGYTRRLGIAVPKR
jgi:hypothetical protein